MCFIICLFDRPRTYVLAYIYIYMCYSIVPNIFISVYIARLCCPSSSSFFVPFARSCSEGPTIISICPHMITCVLQYATLVGTYFVWVELWFSHVNLQCAPILGAPALWVDFWICDVRVQCESTMGAHFFFIMRCWGVAMYTYMRGCSLMGAQFTRHVCDNKLYAAQLQGDRRITQTVQEHAFS